MAETDFTAKHVEYHDPTQFSPEEQKELDAMNADMERLHLMPLWNQIANLMPNEPEPRAVAHVWKWAELYAVAKTAGKLITLHRGGERRAIGLSNPGYPGRPYIAPTLWAAIQYLAPGENAPEHRHSQNAFRFILEGEGVWTVVGGDPVPMKRGDFLLTPGWNYHGHHNIATKPMAWLDGLDIPFVYETDSGFFEYGSEELTDDSTPELSRSERLWSHPGLRPVAFPHSQVSSPIGRYPWVHTDAALKSQLELEAEGHPGVLEPGHAAVRFSNPTTGGDVMPTIRAEFHRLLPGVTTQPRKQVGNQVFQVFEGQADITIGDETFSLVHGDIAVVTSWKQFTITAHDSGVDLFTFSDAPIFEKLNLARTYYPQGA